MVGQQMWFAFVLHGSSHDAPGGYVREVVVLNDESSDGTKIVRYADSGSVTSVGGPFCSGRLFSTEGEGWEFCAQKLRSEALRLEMAATFCAAKAAVKVAA